MYVSGSSGGNEFQSTPPHGRRRVHRSSSAARRAVSIHTSAREATGLRGDASGGLRVSIHASAREATFSNSGKTELDCQRTHTYLRPQKTPKGGARPEKSRKIPKP